MEQTLVLIGIWITLGLSGLGLISMVGFGIRNMVSGKVNPLSIAVVSVPFLLMVALGFITNDWTRSAIITLIVVAVVAMLGIVVSSFRSLFS
jgi:hypothetical protein